MLRFVTKSIILFQIPMEDSLIGIGRYVFLSSFILSVCNSSAFQRNAIKNIMEKSFQIILRELTKH